MNESKKCHYCNEIAVDHETECRQCGALLNGAKPSKLALGLLLTVGSVFALFMLWVGYNLFLSGRTM